MLGIHHSMQPASATAWPARIVDLQHDRIDQHWPPEHGSDGFGTFQRLPNDSTTLGTVWALLNPASGFDGIAFGSMRLVSLTYSWTRA